jgi:circadian clock protein KaiC
VTDRISSGVQRLDAILGGGLPGNAISLIIGLPGTGKTIFAQQFVFTNAQPRRPALYFSTVSEPLERILRYSQPLTFFDSAAVGKSVFYEDLGKVVNESGLSGVLDCMRRPGAQALHRRHR